MHPARWSIALSLGLRQGEALGLLWSDIDLYEGMPRVRRSAQPHTWAHACPTIYGQPSCGSSRCADCDRRHGGGLVLVEPKTKASKRTIVLPVIDELRAHRADVNQRRLAHGVGWDTTYDLVFPSRVDGLIDAARDNTEWNRLFARAGVRDVRLHDARHTAATTLLVMGVPARVVMQILGHSQIGLTLGTYSHVVPELANDAADKIAQAYWK